MVLATNRSISHPYDNRAFQTETPNNLIRPINDINLYEPISAAHTPRPKSQMSEIEVGRTKLHRLLDEVLDKAEPNSSYDPDSESERRRRRRQRRRAHSSSYDPREPLIHGDTPQTLHMPMTVPVSDRPDPTLLRQRYNPYEAGDRAHEIQRGNPVELRPKYSSDDHNIQPRYGQSSHRSNPPLYHDDFALANRQPPRNPNAHRHHQFENDAVYIDTIPKTRDAARPQIHSTWADRPPPPANNDNYFHLNPSDFNGNPSQRHNYRDEYILAKQSVVNTKNLLSSIQDELQHIVVQPSTDNYHA